MKLLKIFPRLSVFMSYSDVSLAISFFPLLSLLLHILFLYFFLPAFSVYLPANKHIHVETWQFQFSPLLSDLISVVIPFRGSLPDPGPIAI